MIGFLQEYRNSHKVVATEYDFIFYSEGAPYHQYMADVFESLLAARRYRICYLTSDAKDPVLQRSAEGLEAYFLKATLMFVFPRLRARALLMTMPNLDLHGYKRSPDVGKYVYLFHALVSTHQQYHEQAFDHYDALFCCGPYHEQEARRAEALRGLKPRDLVPYGYPLLERISSERALKGHDECILVAPSWHPEGILSTCIEALLGQLLPLGLPVFIRPHPEFRKREPKKMKSLEMLVKKQALLHLDTSPDVYNRLASTRLLVTDRSGIALEYAFACKRPVLFIDTPPKIYNRNYTALGIEPVEDRLRPELGRSVAAGNLGEVPAAARALMADAGSWDKKMAALEAATVYGPSQKREGVAYLEGLLS
ncbi:hypothetical protein [Flaviaesturariibacter aridisoli]|uniref:CDP-glycerol--glycerophosphate glycerophosphotransferase n=1 Tax=Flaviaesturariibacter aridisoli TaxID=2545761 RepID=A0A4R4E436_9BACT|nr:hypothetical protein [Flaviaesturariibacter aridisoli]TCZ71398.1 hypothetical protein E0486_09975 [Flaviaesturariibacter aridisoli]